MTKLIVSFYSFANAPKNVRSEGKLGHVCNVCVCVCRLSYPISKAMRRIVLSRAIWRWNAVLRLHYPVINRAISQLVFAETIPYLVSESFFRSQ